MNPHAGRPRWWLAGIAVLAVAAGGWLVAGRTAMPSAAATAADAPAAPAPVAVQVAHPQPGGIARYCVQPGTVMPFESADLYAKVSGFLAEQSLNGQLVDIGTRVKKGDVLARIAVPELDKEVLRDAAKLENAKARVKQFEARVVSAKADAQAAAALVAFAEAELKSKVAYTEFRKKMLDRIKNLADQQAVDARLVDEKLDQYEAALSAQYAAMQQVANAKAQSEAAVARIAAAEADLAESRSEVDVASADLAKSKVWVDYTVIASPYTGVVTKRNFFPGDFIRSASEGGSTPLLAVDRTDLMRIVVPVPDRDVPLVKLGAASTLEPDALPGRKFAGTVSRFAESEELNTRTMRTEIDMPNSDGLLRRGMYGKAMIALNAGTPGAIRVPSAALVGDTKDGTSTVRIVRDGKAHVIPVKLGTDNGIEVEILSGLTAQDEVILQANGPLQEGTAVTARQTGQ